MEVKLYIMTPMLLELIIHGGVHYEMLDFHDKKIRC
jgi:hypothetical protein